MVREWGGAFGCKTKVKEHQDFLILWETEGLVEIIDMHAVEPAGIHSFIESAQHHVSGYDGCILSARLAMIGLWALCGRVGIYIILIIGYHKYGGCAITAWCACINLGQSFG